MINEELIGRVICVCRTPIDYLSPKHYPTVNKEIVGVLASQYKKFGTRYFGLGNLNKMKQVNDG